MISVRVVLKADKQNVKGESPVCICVNKEGKRAYASLDIHCTREQFSQGVIIKHPKAKFYNDVIKMRTSRFERNLQELILSDKVGEMTASDVIKCCGSEDGVKNDSSITIQDLADQYCKNLVNKNTILSMRTTAKILDDYGCIRISEITPLWLRSFEAFLLKKGNKINSIAVYMRNIRALYNYAIDSDLVALDKYPFRRFKIKKEKCNPRVLTLAELKQLRTIELEPYQEEYRDVFMLMFYFCGINMIDLANLRYSGGDYIEFNRAKTGVYTRIRVHHAAKEIIMKYSDGERLIARVSIDKYRDYLHRMNDALQKIGDLKRVGLGGKKIIDINPAYKDLTSYWARHTWATLMTSIDAPQDVITMGLSHADGSMNAVYTKLDFDRLDQWNFKLIELVLARG